MARRSSLGELLGRALHRLCPVCGIGKPFTGWFRLSPHCPHCGHHYEREDGYWVSAMIVCTAVTEALFGIVLVGGVILSWPDVPWLQLLIAGAAMNVLVPVFCYPLSKTAWVAIDVYLNPPEPPLPHTR